MVSTRGLQGDYRHIRGGLILMCGSLRVNKTALLQVTYLVKLIGVSLAKRCPRWTGTERRGRRVGGKWEGAGTKARPSKTLLRCIIVKIWQQTILPQHARVAMSHGQL